MARCTAPDMDIVLRVDARPAPIAVVAAIAVFLKSTVFESLQMAVISSR